MGKILGTFIFLFPSHILKGLPRFQLRTCVERRESQHVQGPGMMRLGTNSEKTQRPTEAGRSWHAD